MTGSIEPLAVSEICFRHLTMQQAFYVTARVVQNPELFAALMDARADKLSSERDCAEAFHAAALAMQSPGAS